MENELIMQCATYLRNQGFEVFVEKEVVEGHSQYGRSDIIARRNDIIYAVECKFVRGDPARLRRVKQQALIYASLIKCKLNLFTKAYIFTEDGLQFLQVVESGDAERRASDFLRRVGL